MLVAAACCWSSACGGTSESTQKQLDALTHRVADLRAANVALVERLDALEAGAAAAPSDLRAAPAGDATQGRPKLAVVHLEPSDGLDAAGRYGQPAVVPGAPVQQGPRPVIKGDPNGVEQLELDEASKADKSARKRAGRGSRR